MKIRDITRAKINEVNVNGDVTLYYPGSSALMHRYKRDGISAMEPNEMLAHLFSMAVDALGQKPSPELMKAIRKYITSGYHQPTISLASTPEFAASQARATAKVGDEMGGDLLDILRHDFGFQGDAFYPDAHPVVLEVDIPASWMERESPNSAIVLIHRDIPTYRIIKVHGA